MPRDSIASFFPALAVIAALGCSGAEDGGEGVKPEQRVPPEDFAVELGVPAGDDGLDFAPIEDGNVLRLQTFGQGGTHLFLGVRTIGFGKRAFIAFTLTNLTNERELVQPAPARPQLLFCHEDDANVCDLVPITVMTGGLTDPDEERDGLAVRIRVDVSNMDGATGDTTREIVLSTEDLR